ncbi:uncharacterized protein NEMAJ01_0322 [Nematocida major]|uniref:uncharacterized protein n=1 Tax=Nematocida major TaxID=1912982 RepID=UPI002008A76A|nr:uncharacterized protein NEMAJ01_0322 [Nematocida major]KAH9385426.1 hypothetical protein NEMAJ01_0322 [Nematocida major]
METDSSIEEEASRDMGSSREKEDSKAPEGTAARAEKIEAKETLEREETHEKTEASEIDFESGRAAATKKSNLRKPGPHKKKRVHFAEPIDDDSSRFYRRERQDAISSKSLRNREELESDFSHELLYALSEASEPRVQTAVLSRKPMHVWKVKEEHKLSEPPAKHAGFVVSLRNKIKSVVCRGCRALKRLLGLGDASKSPPHVPAVVLESSSDCAIDVTTANPASMASQNIFLSKSGNFEAHCLHRRPMEIQGSGRSVVLLTRIPMKAIPARYRLHGGILVHGFLAFRLEKISTHDEFLKYFPMGEKAFIVCASGSECVVCMVLLADARNCVVA